MRLFQAWSLAVPWLFLCGLLLVRLYLLRNYLDGRVSCLVGKDFQCLSIDLIALLQWENETLCMFICLEAKSSLLFPAFLRCHILKESKTGKGQIYSQSWKTMNYLSFESFHYLCMKGSPIIKSKCFFLCMSIRERPELIDFCGIFSFRELGSFTSLAPRSCF